MLEGHFFRPFGDIDGEWRLTSLWEWDVFSGFFGVYNA
jgi:hypothetical protein